MIMLIATGLVVILTGSLFIAGWLYCSHQIRFRDGYDSELESDYQAMIKQYGNFKEEK